MRRLAPVAGIVAMLAVPLLHASPAHAAAVILVGIFGVDNATCGPVQPCRTLQHAVNRAAPGDIIFLGNSVDYGPVTIAKTIHIQGTSGAGIFSPSNAPCLTINGGVNDEITVDTLICDQAGAASDGILFNSGRALHVSNVDFRGGGDSACGVRFRPTGDATLGFFDVILSTWGRGVCLAPRSGADVSGVIANARLQDSQYGIVSTVGAGSVISVICVHCGISGGGTGISSSGAASTVRIRSSRISGNALGLSHPNSGNIVSHGGNAVTGNADNGTVTSTVPPT